jgi:hypothetical protein
VNLGVRLWAPVTAAVGVHDDFREDALTVAGAVTAGEVVS